MTTIAKVTISQPVTLRIKGYMTVADNTMTLIANNV